MYIHRCIYIYIYVYYLFVCIVQRFHYFTQRLRPPQLEFVARREQIEISVLIHMFQQRPRLNLRTIYFCDKIRTCKVASVCVNRNPWRVILGSDPYLVGPACVYGSAADLIFWNSRPLFFVFFVFVCNMFVCAFVIHFYYFCNLIKHPFYAPLTNTILFS